MIVGLKLPSKGGDDCTVGETRGVLGRVSEFIGGGIGTWNGEDTLTLFSFVGLE